jgi:uncharacterized protein (DUF924 family)
MWFYMPLMHSESKADHVKFVQLLKEFQADLEAKGDAESVKYLADMQNFEETHKKIVDQFGRYPYRNASLGRESTEEEVEWLKTGDTFGVSG